MPHGSRRVAGGLGVLSDGSSARGLVARRDRSAARTTHELDNARGHARGVMHAQIRTNSAVWWVTHEKAKVQLERRMRCGPEDAGMLGLSGALAGIAATTVTNPIEP